MAENHGLSAAPVLVIDLRSVFGRDRRNGIVSFLGREEEKTAVCLAISASVTVPAGLLREGAWLTAVRLQGRQQCSGLGSEIGNAPSLSLLLLPRGLTLRMG